MPSRMPASRVQVQGDPTNPCYADPAHRLVFYNKSRPLDYLRVQFNPQSWELSGGVNIGVLAPIGHSSSVLQYGATKHDEVSLDLHFSAWEAYIRGTRFQGAQGVVPVEYMRRWLMSFKHAPALGRAPDHLVVTWPKIAVREVVVQGVSEVVRRLDRKSNVRILTMRLDLLVYIEQFITSGAWRKDNVMFRRPGSPGGLGPWPSAGGK